MRMRKILLLTFVSIGLLLSSCLDTEGTYAPPTFQTFKKLNSKRISEGMIIQYPFDMFVSGDYIFVLALADGKWLQVYDKNTGKYIMGLVAKGQAPGEVITSIMMYYDAADSLVSIYDESLMKLLSFRVGNHLDSLLSFIGQSNLNELNGVVRRAWSLSRNVFLIDGQLGAELGAQKRFQLLSNGEVVDEYNDFPVVKEEEQAFLSPIVSLSPNKKKMAVGTLYGGVLELYDISNEINIRETRMFYPPIFELHAGVIRNTKETIWGFSAMCANDDRLYTVLIGDKNPNLFNNISVFDWNGNEKIKYQTDCLVLRLCCSKDEPEKLYGIAFSEDKEYYMVSFNLNEAL